MEKRQPVSPHCKERNWPFGEVAYLLLLLLFQIYSLHVLRVFRIRHCGLRLELDVGCVGRHDVWRFELVFVGLDVVRGEFSEAVRWLGSWSR